MIIYIYIFSTSLYSIQSEHGDCENEFLMSYVLRMIEVFE